MESIENDINRILISLVEQYPYLYDKKNVHYKNIAMKQVRFSNIGQSLNLSGK